MKALFTRACMAGLIFLVLCSGTGNPSDQISNGITICRENPSFWEFNGKKTLLLGGSVEDNLFQIDSLEAHLDLLLSVGGNYVRNTMSSGDPGNVWPFKLLDSGRYDLNHFNDEYWNRFSVFLEQTALRNIVVQIEVWETFDFYQSNWNVNPYNPKNNINLNARMSKLDTVVSTHPIFTENNFFRSVPSQMALAQVLKYQQRFVDKLLSYSMMYDHVLYCMNNETSVTSEWGKFWAEYIRRAGRNAGKELYTTDMFDPWELDHPFHAEAVNHPEIYQFIEVSQNNHMSGDIHWNNGLDHIQRVRASGVVRPVNNVKIYGNDGGRHKSTRDGIENFVKNIFMGCASARFHRPTSGQGLNGIAQAVIRSMRELTGRMDHFEGQPDIDVLEDRQAGEAFCRAIANKEYAIYFPDGGSISIDLAAFKDQPHIVWLELLTSEWSEPAKLEKKKVSISTPGKGHWIALIQ